LKGFDPTHSRCDGEWYKSIQAVSERLEMWGVPPEEAYRMASEFHEESMREDAP
jgi:hypothetical protein